MQNFNANNKPYIILYPDDYIISCMSEGQLILAVI